MFLKDLFENVNFEKKKSADDNKSMKNYPACKELIKKSSVFGIAKITHPNFIQGQGELFLPHVFIEILILNIFKITISHDRMCILNMYKWFMY